MRGYEELLDKIMDATGCSRHKAEAIVACVVAWVECDESKTTRGVSDE